MQPSFWVSGKTLWYSHSYTYHTLQHRERLIPERLQNDPLLFRQRFCKGEVGWPKVRRHVDSFQFLFELYLAQDVISWCCNHIRRRRIRTYCFIRVCFQICSFQGFNCLYWPSTERCPINATIIYEIFLTVSFGTCAIGHWRRSYQRIQFQTEIIGIGTGTTKSD